LGVEEEKEKRDSEHVTAVQLLNLNYVLITSKVTRHGTPGAPGPNCVATVVGRTLR
jgi:hypothetical protein